jgi:hypothetical protein
MTDLERRFRAWQSGALDLTLSEVGALFDDIRAENERLRDRLRGIGGHDVEKYYGDVDDLVISTYVKNRLKRAGLLTFDDIRKLLRYAESHGFVQVRGMGIKSIRQLRVAMVEIGEYKENE